MELFLPEVFGLFHKGDVDDSHLARHHGDAWLYAATWDPENRLTHATGLIVYMGENSECKGRRKVGTL